MGAALLQILLDSPAYTRVTALLRRPLAFSHPKLTQVVADFDQLEQHREYFRVDDVFCCLGTTIKVAGSQAAFRKVDQEYPAAMARLTQESGAQQFLLVTAMGADPNSRIFYNRVKGEAEAAVRTAGLPAVHFFRPSILTGPRAEFRLGERVGIGVMQVLRPLLPRTYRPIAGRTVAQAMHNVAQQGRGGAHVYESDQIALLGKV